MTDYQPLYANSYALVIGIDKYEHLEPLGTAVRGARDLADLLEDRFDFKVTLLADADVTRANITGWLDSMRLNAGPDDRLLVYFAGHGLTFGTHAKQGYLALPESRASLPGSALQMRTVLDYAEIMTAKHLCFILDACFGGLALPVHKGRFEDKAAAALVQDVAVQVMTAGDEDERVPDGYGPGNLYSLFTWLVMEGLEGRGTSHGILTARSLYDYVRVNTAQIVGTALTPMLCATLASKGDFVFSELRRMKPPAPLEVPVPDLSKYVQALYATALTHLHAGELKEAHAALRDVLDLDPNHPRAQEKLAEVEERLAPPPPRPRKSPRRAKPKPAPPPEDKGLVPEGESPPVEVVAPPPPEPVVVVEPEPKRRRPPPFTLPMLEWCDIPAGKVTLADNAGTFHVEAFRIGKYPVTYAQFRAFVDAPDGFHNAEWWQGLAADEDDRSEPGQQKWPIDNHPRENVSWYDAVAFCRWLSRKLGYEVRLPTEWEWQRAAQGDDGREYPWGNEFGEVWCNTIESGIEQTTPVDRYPEGVSPYGVYDMSGNVWEWCLNEYGNPEDVGLAGSESRVLRGGAWGILRHGARAAFRHWSFPEALSGNVGFRCCARS
jgi:hypothetical protein